MSAVEPRSGERRSEPKLTSGQPSWTPPPFSIRPPSDESGTVNMAVVLHGEEVARARVFFRIILLVSLMTAAFMPLLTGPTWQRVTSGVLCTAAAVMSAVLLILVRRQERYTPALATGVGVACSFIGVGVIYYIGLFSAAAMILVVGTFFFGMSHSRMVARSTYASIAALYLVLTVLIAANIIPDQSLFSTENALPFTRWFQVIMSQVIFALTFYLARSTRRATEGAVDRVNKATLQVKKRDALLAEANSELDKKTRPSDGRFTGIELDGFSVGEMIGRGAMGEVYKGTDKAGMPVALKFLHQNLAESPDKVKRFMREAEAAAAVESPHVPRTFGSGWTKDGSAPYLAMELLDGHDLSWHLRKTGRLQLKLVAEMVEHVAKALAHVREADVVHRDLKPANIFLTDSLPRTWKVLDFGLSKLMWESGSLTRDHAVGTPSYMSPEQVRGPTVDHLADLYALAAIAYRALTGVPPFAGSEIAHVLYRVVYQQPVCPGDLVQLPVDIELILALGLAKKAEDRFENVEQFARAFVAAYQGKLDNDTRARAWTLVKEMPWGSSTKPTPRKKSGKKKSGDAAA
jgi:tRNA A-37 threonylcarbamoyl transferase component Bud32